MSERPFQLLVEHQHALSKRIDSLERISKPEELTSPFPPNDDSILKQALMEAVGMRLLPGFVFRLLCRLSKELKEA